MSHLLTAFAYILIGGTLLAIAALGWRLTPLERVRRCGDLLTADGLRFVITHWGIVYLFGILIVTAGINDMADWSVHYGSLDPDWLSFTSGAQTVVSAATAACFVWMVVRRWIKR